MDRFTVLFFCLGFLSLGFGLGVGWAHTWTAYPALIGTTGLIVGAALLLAATLRRLRE